MKIPSLTQEQIIAALLEAGIQPHYHQICLPLWSGYYNHHRGDVSRTKVSLLAIVCEIEIKAAWLRG